MANIELTLTPASPTGSMVFTLGAPGPQGLAGTMVVGTVTTGAPGSFADIVNVGTASAAILDFTIPRGDEGIQGIQGIQGIPGTSGVIYATSPLSYNSGTQTVSIDLSAYATQSYVNSQGFITSSALSPYLTSATAASTYLAKSGGYITGDIQSNNGSGYRSWDGATNTTVLVSNYLQLNKSGAGGGALTVEWDGITFPGGKQTLPFLGLAGYATEAWVTNGFYPLTGNPSSFLTASSLVGYATESFVTSQGYITQTTADGLYYPLTGNPSGFLTSAPVTSVAGKVGAVTLDNTDISGLGTLAVVNDAPSDGYTYGRNNGAWTVAGGGGLITSVTSPLVVTSGDLSIDLTGYATETFVTTQGYITQGTADGLYYPLTGNPSGFLTSVPPPSLTGLTSDISWDNYSNTGRFLITGGSSPDGMFFSARFNFDSFVPNQPSTGDLWFNGADFFYQGGGVKTIASQSWVTSQGYATTGQLSAYAPLAGATFSGKVNTTVTATTAPINIGSQLTAPTTTVAGDVWIGANINYKSWDGVTKAVANTNTTNQFTQGQAITVNSAVNAFRINQQGTGPALVVEDSVSPDATPFVIDANGKVGVGIAPDATAAIKVDANGISFNGLVFNPTATAAHTGGSDTLDLLVTINGTNYRLGLRPA